MEVEARERPVYGPAEAAWLVALPRKTLTSWAFGRRYPTSAGPQRWEPLIEPADPKRRLLSFANLVELHVLAALRSCEPAFRVPVPNIRQGLDFMRAHNNTKHPLADLVVHTDFVDLYVEAFEKLFNAARGQAAIREAVEPYLVRVERDGGGRAVRLFPQTRPVELGPRTVAIDPRLRFGRPTLAGTGIETAILKARFSAGDSFEDIAEDLDLAPHLVEEAIRFESREAEHAA